MRGRLTSCTGSSSSGSSSEQLWSLGHESVPTRFTPCAGMPGLSLTSNDGMSWRCAKATISMAAGGVASLSALCMEQDVESSKVAFSRSLAFLAAKIG